MRLSAATILIKTTSSDSDNVVIASFAGTETVRGHWVPAQNNIIARAYGLKIDVENRFFTKAHNDSLIEGNRLQVGSVQYDIFSVDDYGSWQEVGVRKAIL